jgi:hypothetical protein
MQPLDARRSIGELIAELTRRACETARELSGDLTCKVQFRSTGSVRVRDWINGTELDDAVERSTCV